MSFIFPDPSITTTATNPDTGITYEYADGMWTPVSTDAEQAGVDAINTRLTDAENINYRQGQEIEQNEELLEPVNTALINLATRIASIETLDVASAVSALALAQQDIIDLKSKVNTLELTSFLIME